MGIYKGIFENRNIIALRLRFWWICGLYFDLVGRFVTIYAADWDLLLIACRSGNLLADILAAANYGADVLDKLDVLDVDRLIYLTCCEFWLKMRWSGDKSAIDGLRYGLGGCARARWSLALCSPVNRPAPYRGIAMTEGHYAADPAIIEDNSCGRKIAGKSGIQRPKRLNCR